MRIAVTGGSGFVGSHVVDALLKDGHDAVIVDREPPKWHPSNAWREADVRDRHALFNALSGAQVVMHLAAMSNTQAAVRDPKLCTELNCMGTVNVLEMAKNVGAERVVIAGSTLVSGLQVPHKMHWPNEYYEEGEDPYLVLPEGVDDWVVDEESPIVPTQSAHPYVTSKVFEEMIARDFAQQFDLPVTVLRYGIMYGERMTPGVVVHSFIERALAGKPLVIEGDGQQWRQYLHVSDMTRAHLEVLDAWENSENQTFNICPQRKVTIADLAEAVCQAVPGTAVEYGPARPGDIAVRFCMADKARRLLGWEPKLDLQQGVARTVEWYRKHLASGMPRK